MASDYDRLELKRAAKPPVFFRSEDDTGAGAPYLQIVEPGLTELGPFTPVLHDRRRLHVSARR